MKSNKVLVIGSGGIGSLYGAKLHQAGAQVSVLCRSDYDVVKSRGISVKSHWGNIDFQPEQVIKNAKDYIGAADFVLVATKVLPHVNVPNIIAPVVGKDTTIILLQNGIDIEGDVKAAFPNNELISGLAFVCVTRIESGIVNHSDYGRTVFGVYPKGSSVKLRNLCQMFQKAEVECKEDDDIGRSRWKKMIWNASFNSISVLAGAVQTDVMVKNPELLKLVRNVMHEVYSIAKKCGYELKPEIIASNIDATLKMSSYKTSMLIDYENKREMEVEAILGNVVRIAQKKNISIPYIETMYALLSSINKTIIS
jgi:2-dehydropantoate 2-reductase